LLQDINNFIFSSALRLLLSNWGKSHDPPKAVMAVVNDQNTGCEEAAV